MSNAINVTIVCDESDNAFAIFLDVVLCETNEFNVIIRE